MAEQSAQELIAQLRNFRTRSRAADRLVAMGQEAVGPLLEALDQEGQEGARWAILNCLGELAAEEAVPTIAQYLDDPDYQTVAHDALVKITGRDMGLVARDWLRSVGRQAPAAAEQGQLDDGRLVELALEDSGARLAEESDERYSVSLPVGPGHRRDVSVLFGLTDHEDSPIVVIYCDCGEAAPEHYETVLRRNLRMPYGAVSLRDVGGTPHFVMFNTILREGLSPAELRKSIFTVGERAQRVAEEICD
ncbi:MAG: YbjN domain-containing protein [Candidatus Brocadiia bacterium]